MKLKIIACLLILAVAIGAGCSGQQADTEPEEQVNDTITEQEEQNNETEVQVASPEVNTTSDSMEVVEGEPELKITSVSSGDNGLIVDVRNVGNATAERVYSGVILFSVSNEKAYDEYVTAEDFKVMSNALEEGVTGESFEYETNYSYKDTPNMTFYYKLSAIDDMGDIPAGEVAEGHPSIVYRSYKGEYLKVAWMDGQEEDFVIY
ncbi:MAG: hypothetical protein CI953_821 [Methanohalophilus sp.]|nr:MAG: hypothetical protein CI953_821 [Methanohalophilus sp.]